MRGAAEREADDELRDGHPRLRLQPRVEALHDAEADDRGQRHDQDRRADRKQGPFDLRQAGVVGEVAPLPAFVGPLRSSPQMLLDLGRGRRCRRRRRDRSAARRCPRPGHRRRPSTLSPTWIASAASQPATSRATSKIAGSGLREPAVGRGDDAVEASRSGRPARARRAGRSPSWRRRSSAGRARAAGRAPGSRPRRPRRRSRPSSPRPRRRGRAPPERISAASARRAARVASSVASWAWAA